MSKKKKRDPPPSFATSGDWHKHFTPLFDDQLDSLAYISLTAVAKEAYIILRQEYKGSYTGNKVICPYKTFISKGMSRNSIPKALKMLVAFGFITYEQGGLEHQPSIYHFSEEWKEVRSPTDVECIKVKLAEKAADEKDRKEKAKSKLALTI